jgi:hypothetical protein
MGTWLRGTSGNVGFYFKMKKTKYFNLLVGRSLVLVAVRI